MFVPKQKCSIKLVKVEPLNQTDCQNERPERPEEQKSGLTQASIFTVGQERMLDVLNKR